MPADYETKAAATSVDVEFDQIKEGHSEQPDSGGTSDGQSNKAEPQLKPSMVESPVKGAENKTNLLAASTELMRPMSYQADMAESQSILQDLGREPDVNNNASFAMISDKQS